jgi:methylenetetrahydrofolate dehydrogenase (NADP+)/methenyltetrahydrofolate cyclohydrolase
MILEGNVVADQTLAEIRAGVARLRDRHGVSPSLAVLLLGTDPASALYVRSKKRMAASVGIESPDHVYPEGLSREALLALIDRLNADPTVHGILPQLPLPRGIDEDEVIARIAPDKDVDGIHPVNMGRLLAGSPAVLPCTPSGCLALLDHYGAKLEGAEAVVIGRSRIVGKPLAQMLLARHATVTMCHTRTRDLGFHTRRADVLCVAVGRAGLITADMVKPDAWVIDVGNTQLPSGQWVGDVDFPAVSAHAHVTPVPGGVGPMTRAMLLRNTLQAAERILGAAPRRPAAASA